MEELRALIRGVLRLSRHAQRRTRMTQSRHNTVDYIEFPATDITATKTFYTKAFGWNFVDYGPDYSSFQDGRIAGGFTREGTPTGGGPLVVIHVDDLNEKVVAAGGRIRKEIFSFPGGSRFHFLDPSGNQLAAWHDDSAGQ
jgi:hypothetical protein